MSKYEYFKNILKQKCQHGENKGINGYYCDGNGYKFWINKDNFNNLFENIDEN